jgi:hypothetical protein
VPPIREILKVEGGPCSRGDQRMKANSFGLVCAALVVAPLSTHSAVAATFDDWTLGPYATAGINDFSSGPAFATGSNSMTLTFGNAVLGPATLPQSLSCGQSGFGLCSNFYYTVPENLIMNSPKFSLISGNVYTINFDELGSLQSTADFFRDIPEITLTYNYSGSQLFTLLPLNNLPSHVSLNFIAPMTGEVNFNISIQGGLEPNGGSSSSVASFTESGSYQFSDFSITGTFAPSPSPVPVPNVGSGLPGIVFASVGMLTWWRRKRNGAAVARSGGG